MYIYTTCIHEYILIVFTYIESKLALSWDLTPFCILTALESSSSRQNFPADALEWYTIQTLVFLFLFAKHSGIEKQYFYNSQKNGKLNWIRHSFCFIYPKIYMHKYFHKMNMYSLQIMKGSFYIHISYHVRFLHKTQFVWCGDRMWLYHSIAILTFVLSNYASWVNLLKSHTITYHTHKNIYLFR